MEDILSLDQLETLDLKSQSNKEDSVEDIKDKLLNRVSVVDIKIQKSIRSIKSVKKNKA